MCVYSMFVYVGARFCLLLANSIICIIAYLQYVPHYKSVSDKYKCHTFYPCFWHVTDHMTRNSCWCMTANRVNMNEEFSFTLLMSCAGGTGSMIIIISLLARFDPLSARYTGDNVTNTELTHSAGEHRTLVWSLSQRVLHPDWWVCVHSDTHALCSAAHKLNYKSTYFEYII